MLRSGDQFAVITLARISLGNTIEFRKGALDARTKGRTRSSGGMRVKKEMLEEKERENGSEVRLPKTSSVGTRRRRAVDWENRIMHGEVPAAEIKRCARGSCQVRDRREAANFRRASMAGNEST